MLVTSPIFWPIVSHISYFNSQFRNVSHIISTLFCLLLGPSPVFVTKLVISPLFCLLLVTYPIFVPSPFAFALPVPQNLRNKPWSSSG